MTYVPIPREEITEELTRGLDRVQGQVFIGKAAAFLGSLMGGSEVIWTRDIPTAATDGICIWWNPDFFLRSTMNLNKSVLVHELWHIGRLHCIRCGARDPDDWNSACDFVINADMDQDGFIFEGFKPLLDKQYKDMAEEEVYDLLQSMPKTPLPPELRDVGPGGKPTDEQKQIILNKVITAVHAAHMAHDAGSIPGNIEEMISKFLTPIVPWQKLLQDFFQDLQDTKYTWARPNRRYTDIYLPSRVEDEGRLQHLIYYCDVSGSISSADALRFNSELKYVFDTFQPKRVTAVQFDTRIQKIDEWNEGDLFNEVKIVGRGGTSLECVRQHIEENKPTAAVIFSDLYCSPMGPIPKDIPVIWVVVNNAGATVPYGKKIHIK